MELSQEAQQGQLSQPADHTLHEAIKDLLLLKRPAVGMTAEDIDQATRDQADAVMDLLTNTGHYLPGCPPAALILRDAKSFAERLTLSNLALRILNMLAWAAIETPESKPARKFIDDYLEGRNHGPVGHPMLWPGQLPGLAQLLRDWGFAPTVALPGQPSYVARNIAPVTPS